MKPKKFAPQRWFVSTLILCVLALAWWSNSAAGYPAIPAASPTPGVSPTPAASHTPQPSPTPAGQPPVVINILPSLGGGGGGAPQAPQDNSAPVLSITGYRTDPSPVQSGQPFTLTIAVTNTGTKYANGIRASVGGGSSFVGLGAPVSVAEQLDPKQSATFSLVVQPASLAGGAYPLTVQFNYRVGESGEQGTSGSVGIQVAGSGSGVRGDPQVVVRSAIPLTQPNAIGAAFDVQVVLSNAGPRKAYGVNTTLVQNDFLSAAEGSGSGSAGDLAPGQTVTLTLSLVLTKATDTGRVSQTFKLAYRDANNTAFSNNETASLDLALSGNQKPQLIITSQTILPEHPGPGDIFTLTLQVRNVGAGTARQVLARLGKDGDLKPFVPLGTGNVGFVDQIAPGATAAFSTTLLMDGASAGGVYTIPVVLSYGDALSEPLTETEVVGVLTLSRPQLQIDLTKAVPEPLAAGQSFDLPVEIINIGRQTLGVTTVEVQSDDLTVTKSSAYVGPLDASISGSLTAKAVAQHAGTATFRVIVHYRDELNQMQTAVQNFNVQVAADAPAPVTATANTPAAQTSQGGLMALLLRLVGLGGLAVRLIDLLKLTGTNLTRTRFRAALSAFGVVIGTGAIVILFSLASGLQKLAADNLGGFGPLNEISVFSLGGPAGGGGGGGFNVVIIGINKAASSKLKPDYLDTLAALPGVKAITPVVNFNGQAKVRDEQYEASPNLKGVDPAAPANFNYALTSGTPDLGRWQVLVGAKVGEAFSDPGVRSGDNRVPRLDLQGKSLTLELSRTDAGVTTRRVLHLQVAGVLAPRGFDYDYSIIMRLSDVDELNTWASGQQVNHQRSGYPGATVLAADAKSQTALTDQIQKDGFLATSANQILEQVNRTYYALQAFVGGVGLITLLIAGTGIANTLITAIYERTAEIGLMKAVGATTRQVMAVFLAEAAGIGGGGGLVGLVVGLLLSQAINAVASQSVAQQLSGPGGASGPVNIVATPLWLVVLAPVFAMAIGILAGLYPARRAAHLDPVTALRYE